MDCVLCARHRGEGPLSGQLVGRWDGFWVYHAPAGDDGRAPLGYLLIESERHALTLSDLTDPAAEALGRLRTRLARALRRELTAEYALASVIGSGAPHFHEHVVTRHRGTSPDVPWHRSEEAAPRGDEQDIAAMVRRLAAVAMGRP